MLKKPVGAAFEGWGVGETGLQATITGELEPESQFVGVCFDYERAASEDPTSVSDDILDRLKKNLSPPQIIQLACVVGFWKFYNAVHVSLHIPVESPLLQDTGYVNL